MQEAHLVPFSFLALVVALADGPELFRGPRASVQILFWLCLLGQCDASLRLPIDGNRVTPFASPPLTTFECSHLKLTNKCPPGPSMACVFWFYRCLFPIASDQASSFLPLGSALGDICPFSYKCLHVHFGSAGALCKPRKLNVVPFARVGLSTNALYRPTNGSVQRLDLAGADPHNEQRQDEACATRLGQESCDTWELCNQTQGPRASCAVFRLFNIAEDFLDSVWLRQPP